MHSALESCRPRARSRTAPSSAGRASTGKREECVRSEPRRLGAPRASRAARKAPRSASSRAPCNRLRPPSSFGPGQQLRMPPAQSLTFKQSRVGSTRASASVETVRRGVHKQTLRLDDLSLCKERVGASGDAEPAPGPWRRAADVRVCSCMPMRVEFYPGDGFGLPPLQVTASHEGAIRIHASMCRCRRTRPSRSSRALLRSAAITERACTRWSRVEPGGHYAARMRRCEGCTATDGPLRRHAPRAH